MILESNLIQSIQNAVLPSPHKKTAAKGICINCDNRKHCNWLENNKTFCEHHQ